MASTQDIQDIVRTLCDGIRQIFQQERIDTILFGSYARGDADAGSDIDVLLLLDVPRQLISERSWQVGELAAELLMEYGVVVSPIVENRSYFDSNVKLLPFYQSIQTEGVKMSA